jgi:hypothetical protein
MALDYEWFDQAQGEGWRRHGDGEIHPRKCYLAAARLIERYEKAHPDLPPDSHCLLTFHAGQCYAFGHSYRRAIAKFEHTYKDGVDYWNSYVGATISFLQRDRAALLEEREELAATGTKLNLNVVDRLVKYFDESYLYAYRGIDTNAGKQTE